MRKLAALLLGSALLATAPLQAGPRMEPEEELAKVLDGRVAGQPVDCINLRNIRSSRIIDKTAIVYDAGSTIYVNRPRSGGEGLNDWDTLVTRTHSTQLCSIDVVQLYDTTARMPTGVVFLGDFVPYKRAGRSY